MLRVLLADDSDLILDRLQQMLRLHPLVEIAGSFKDGIKTLEALKSLKPRILTAADVLSTALTAVG